MNLPRKSLVGWLAASAVLLVAVTAHAQAPDFISRLNDDEFEKQAAAVLTEFGDFDAAAASNTPSVGAFISRIRPGSRAEEAGLQDGDYVTACDGQPMWSYWTPTHRDGVELQLITSRSADDADVQKLVLNQEPIGAHLRPVWRPELEYLRRGQRDRKWDRYAVIGLLTRDSSPALCETAWAKAISAGYQPDAASAICGALACLKTNRYEDAAKYMTAAEAATDFSDLPYSRWLQPMLGARVALTTDRFPDIANLVRRHPNGFEFTPQNFLAYLQQIKEQAGDDRAFDPDDFRLTSERFLLDDLKERLVGFTVCSVEQYLPQVRLAGGVQLEGESGSFNSFLFGPLEPIRDLRVSVEFTAEPYDAEWSYWSKAVEVGLTRRDAIPTFGLRGGHIPGRVATVELDAKGQVRPVLGNFGVGQFSYNDPEIKLDGQTKHTVQITRIGQYVEILVNGRRVLRGPADASPHVSMFVRAVGTKAKFTNFQACELVPRAGAGAAPPAAPGAFGKPLGAD